MSLAINEGGSDASTPSANRPMGRFVPSDVYAPDLSAYASDPANNVSQRVASMAAKRESVTVSIPAHDGIRESVKLKGVAAEKYFRGGIEERMALVAPKIREARKARAISGLKRLSEGASIAELPPLEEAALREFGAFETREVVRESTDGYEHVEIESLREDFGGGGLDSIAQSTNPLDQEFLTFNGPSGKQLYYSDVLEQNAKCFFAWNHDPIAHEACSLIRNFVIGRGMNISCNDDKLQSFVDAFTARESMEDRVKSWTVSLSRDGELFVRIIRPGNGTVKVRSLDPMTIWEVVTDAEDIETVFFYVQRYLTRTQIISPPNGNGQEWIDRYLDPRDVIHAKVNVSDGEVRGRSDLYPVLGYMKRLRDLFDTLVTREQSQAAYVHDYTVNGSPADVAAFSLNSIPQGKVTPGSSFVHNEAVKVQVLQPGGSKTTDTGSVYEGLINMIAVGLGIAKDYLGITSRGSRATALVATAPSAMRFEERQEVIGSVIQRVYEAAIAEGRASGDLDDVEDFTFKVGFAAIQKDDSVAKVDLINQGVGMSYISRKTAASVFASEIDLDDFDYLEEQKQIGIERLGGSLILAKYAAIPFGDSSTGIAGATPTTDGATDASVPQGDKSPLSGAGASQIKHDLGPGARESWATFTERYAGGYA